MKPSPNRQSPLPPHCRWRAALVCSARDRGSRAQKGRRLGGIALTGRGLAGLGRAGALLVATLASLGLGVTMAQAQQRPAVAAPATAPTGGAPVPGGTAAPGGAAGAAGPAAPAGGGAPAEAGATYFRIGFLALDQWSYTQHPFQQITGNGNFANGHAAGGSSFSFGTPASDSKSDVWVQLLHALPPFYLEAAKPVDLFLPKGASIGFDHYVFFQTASGAATGSGIVPPIQTDVFLYQLSLRVYGFDPNSVGINYFIGVGAGSLQGKMTAQPFAAQAPQVIAIGQTPTGSVLLGIETKGENIGVRYELNLISASSVALASNPYPNSSATKVNFSGSITRVSMFYQF